MKQTANTNESTLGKALKNVRAENAETARDTARAAQRASDKGGDQAAAAHDEAPRAQNRAHERTARGER